MAGDLEIINSLAIVPALGTVDVCIQLPPGPKTLLEVQLDVTPTGTDSGSRIWASTKVSPANHLDPSNIWLLGDRFDAPMGAGVNRLVVRPCKPLPDGFDVI